MALKNHRSSDYHCRRLKYEPLPSWKIFVHARAVSYERQEPEIGMFFKNSNWWKDQWVASAIRYQKCSYQMLCNRPIFSWNLNSWVMCTKWSPPTIEQDALESACKGKIKCPCLEDSCFELLMILCSKRLALRPTRDNIKNPVSSAFKLNAATQSGGFWHSCNLENCLMKSVLKRAYCTVETNEKYNRIINFRKELSRGTA